MASDNSIKPMFGSWDDEESYWRDQYASRPYGAGSPYERWQPAYRFGYESAQRYQGREWSDIEDDLRRDWDRSPGRDDRSTWEQMKDAVRDAWNRLTSSNR